MKSEIAVRLAGITVALTIAGCINLGPASNGDVKQVEEKIAASGGGITALARARGEQAATGIRRAGRPWYGDSDESLRSRDPGTGTGLPLPLRLERPNAVAVTIGRGEPVGTAADIVAAAAGIPVAVRTEVTGPDGRIIAIPVRGGRPITHDGPLSLLLERIAAEYDLFWRFDGRQIRLSAMAARSWTLPAPPAVTRISAAAGGLDSGGGRSVSLSRDSVHDSWADLTRLLEAVVEPPGRIVAAGGSGRVMVTGRPSALAAAARVIRDWEATHSARIAIEVAVYQLDSKRERDFRLSLLSLGGPAGAAKITAAEGSAAIIGSVHDNAFSLDFTAVAGHDAVISWRTASTVALSGSPAPIILTSARNYVSSVSRTEDGGTTVETATVDDGLSIHLVPRLVAGGRIQLSLTLMLNDFRGLTSFGDVQLPQIDQRMVANDVLLAPGETLLLSGYEQASESAGRASGMLTTGHSAESDRVTLVLLVRPTVSDA